MISSIYIIGDDSLRNKIICEYRGGFSDFDPSIPDLDINFIPQECDIILYARFSIDTYNYVNVDYGKLYIIFYTLNVDIS